MFNGENEAGQPGSSSSYNFTKYYDMWGTQYDFCFYLNKAVWASCWEKESIVEEEDLNTIRLITRDSLYTDPVICSEDAVEDPQTSSCYSGGYDWIEQNMRKDGHNCPQQGSGKSKNAKVVKKLGTVAQPAKMEKAESIMAKMGWQGGALGRTGDGIMEPIAPNTDYAQNTVGFGQPEKPTNVQPKVNKTTKRKTKADRTNFTTNTLQFILDFVKNDREIEVIFEESLRKGERKKIHEIVNRFYKEPAVVYGSVVKKCLAKTIQERNPYLLCTQSEGDPPKRNLYLYKEAPDHMYLIVPDDFSDEVDEEKDKKDEKDKAVEMEVEEENPFLKSITRNLKKEEMPKEKECKRAKPGTKWEKIIHFFVEFAEKNYTEFRFLGPFSKEELENINKFLRYFSKCVQDSENAMRYFLDEKMYEILTKRDVHFEITEDCNGNPVIYKHRKEDTKPS